MGLWRRTAEWKARRVRALLKRDGRHCWLCNRPLAATTPKEGRRTTLEQLIPRCMEGGDGLDNLVLCHAACNRHLRDHPPEKKRKIREKWHRETARVIARRR
ncbi:MAG TPA: hypothetical protein VGC56_12475 [Allosphingosinicella sp.]|jgi:hypothetical protein